MSGSSRSIPVTAAGLLILAIGAGAVLLPLAADLPARQVIGWMLLSAGLLEALASSSARSQRRMTAAAGVVTTAAGLRLLLDADAGFFETLNLVILWLVLRSAVHALPALRRHHALNRWSALAAAVDFLLAVALLAGLPVAYLTVGLFGPSKPISATFAWILAISFAANGISLVARAAPDGSGSPPPGP